MNHIELIKRGWRMTWRFRVLWIFGILLALTSGGGGGGGGGSGGSNTVSSLPGMTGPAWATLAGLIVLCCCLLLIFVVIAIFVHYVAQAALYRMADTIEATGAAPTWREGFRLGWTNRTFRLFLLDLAWGIPVAIVVLLLIALTFAPIFFLSREPFSRGSGGPETLALVLTVGIGLGSVLIVLAIAAVISLLRQFWGREVVLHDLSVGQALAGGIALVRSRLGDVALLWLIMFGIGLLFFLVTFPLLIALLLLGAAVGGGLGWGLYELTRSVVLAVIVGLPIFLVILVVPLTLVRGVYLTWESSTWTLAYREVTGAAAPGNVVAEVQPQL